MLENVYSQPNAAYQGDGNLYYIFQIILKTGIAADNDNRIVRAMKNHIAKTIRRIIFTTFQIQKGKLYISPSRTDLISSLVGLFGSSVKTAFIIPSRQM